MQRSTILLVLAVIGLMGCSPRPLEPSPHPETVAPTIVSGFFPPTIYALVDDQRSIEAGFSMVEGAKGEITDYLDPDPLAEAATISGGEIILEIDGVLPDKMTMGLSEINPDGTTKWRDAARTELIPTEPVIHWSPRVEPGRYVMGIGSTWNDGREASYWLVVEFK